jgi:hypothetical protein
VPASGVHEDDVVAACCVIPKVWPATVNEPLRDTVVALAATAYDNVTPPLPDPPLPEVMVIQELFDDALHDPLHPDGDPVTVIDDVPPAAANDAVEALME